MVKSNSLYDNPNIAFYEKTSELDNERGLFHCAEIMSKYCYGKVLDVGAGQGSVTQALTRNTFVIEDITAIEKSYYNIRHLRKIGIRNIISFNIDQYPFPLASETFDTIICTDVIEHLLSPYLLLTEIHRLLKPNGNLILVTPDARRAPITTPHIHYFSPATIECMFKRTGYYRIKRIYNGILSPKLTNLIQHIPLIRGILSNGCYYIARKQ